MHGWLVALATKYCGNGWGGFAIAVALEVGVVALLLHSWWIGVRSYVEFFRGGWRRKKVEPDPFAVQVTSTGQPLVQARDPWGRPTGEYIDARPLLESLASKKSPRVMIGGVEAPAKRRAG